MQHFALADVLAQRQQTGRPYLEFLREPSLSLGLYALPAGGVDGQKPHTEDEVYYILSGRGAIQVADESRPVEPGSLVFVAAGVEHRFHSITEDLQI
ncbi:MAG TPA: cupin domain-containing protein, partial [Ktedonobacterales bacterium]